MCSLVRESIVNQDVSCVSSQENVAGLDGHHTVDLYCGDHESLWWEEGGGGGGGEGWDGRKGETRRGGGGENGGGGREEGEMGGKVVEVRRGRSSNM